MSRTSSDSPVGSVIFSLAALLTISAGVLLLLRRYLPLRATPLYLLVPIFFAISLPLSIVLLVPIDLATSARYQDNAGRGIWLPEGALLVAWRICYWLTFCLSWFVLPILGEYADAGHRDPQHKLMFSLRANAYYYSMYLGVGILGLVYIFVSSGATPTSLKGLVMALAYCWGLILAIYLMGHGLVAIPRSCFRKASITGRLKRIQIRAPGLHEKMEDAIQDLQNLEAHVAELGQRKTGSAVTYRDWIEELVEEAHLPELRPRALSRQETGTVGTVPTVITERYLADLSRQLLRARHSRARYLDEWEELLHDSVKAQAVIDSAASKRIPIGRPSPHASTWALVAFHTPFSRYIWRYWVVPYSWALLGAFLSLCSFCIVWSEVIKTVNPLFSIISSTVVHHPNSTGGQIGIFGQFIAACWILYMCFAALRTLTDVKVWRGRALVRRNTHGESASWYALQLTKLSIPLSYNFLTFLSPALYEDTVFYEFLGSLINLTPLGGWFDLLFPAFVLLPVCATLFNLYGKVKDWIGYDNYIGDEDDMEDGVTLSSSWRAGKELIERELNGQSSLGLDIGGGSSGTFVPNNPHNREAPTLSVPPATSSQAGTAASSSQQGTRQPTRPQQRPTIEAEEAEENFFEALAHRMKNTFETADTPEWIQNIKKPKWMTGNDGDGSPAAGPSDFTRWFGGGRQDGRLRLG